MKIKSHSKFTFFFKFLKLFKKKYNKLFNSLYKQKLNSIILHLLENSIEIENIYDVGAFQGKWTKQMNETCLKKSRFFMFEANIENEIHLKNLDHKYFINVLSDKTKSVKFYSKSHSGDSYYLEKTKFYEDTIKPKSLLTTTLNDIQKTQNIPLPDFLKIDTQGSEIDILIGANKILKNCKIILLECPIVSYNIGAPPLQKYIDYLDKIDFLPLDITEIHHLDKVLVQVDIIFLKRQIFHQIYKEKKLLKHLVQ